MASLSLLVGAPAFSQSAAGLAAISGVVRDPSGAVVPNAQVVIASDSKGPLRTVTTNGGGLFTAAALPPSPGYKVSVVATGYATYEAEGLDLQVGQNLNLNVSLMVGRNVTAVDVSATAATVQDTKTDVSQVIDTKQISDLPINGRRVDSFVLLTPGVTNDGTFGLLSFRGVAGGNSFLIDGNDTTEQFYNENAGRTRIAVADLAGRRAGVPGGLRQLLRRIRPRHGRRGQYRHQERNQQLHGTAYWFFRNRTFNARDRYATSIRPKCAIRPAAASAVRSSRTSCSTS